MKTLRILVADDHALMRRGVKTLLQTHAGWEVCGQALSGREAVAKAKKLRPDIVILDFSMPGLNGLDAGRRIREVMSGKRVNQDLFVFRLEDSRSGMRCARTADTTPVISQLMAHK